jgi:inhibitor of cysteine peptidase
MRRGLAIVVAVVILGGMAFGLNWYLGRQAVASNEEGVIALEVGKAAEISLPSNPSTGYSWVATFDASLVELADQRYVAPATGALGAAGTEVFVFKGLKKGRVTVVFEYKRSWETQVADSKQVVLDIR